MFFYHFPSSHLTILYIILYFTPLGWGDGGGGRRGGGLPWILPLRILSIYLYLLTSESHLPHTHIEKDQKYTYIFHLLPIEENMYFWESSRHFWALRLWHFVGQKRPSIKKINNRVISNVRKYILVTSINLQYFQPVYECTLGWNYFNNLLIRNHNWKI